MPFDLTEGRVRDRASSESFRRDEDYYRQGAVLSLTRRGGVLRAEVAGSEFSPYEVSVAYDEANITEAACDCPYEWGGWCKHIVATLRAEAVGHVGPAQEVDRVLMHCRPFQPQCGGPEALLHLRVIAATGRVADPACHLFVAGV